MGCVRSKPANPQDSRPSALKSPSFRNTSSGPLSDRELLARIDAPKRSQQMTIDGITFKYAWVCQRGYYPDALDKENQDTYTVQPKFTNENVAFFGVFDGHGKEGHLCSRFVRDNLPKTICTEIAVIGNDSNTEAVKKALSAAHFTVNDALHSVIGIDDSLSGTTSITVLMKGKKMFVSNVGDSRAIIAYREDERLVAKPMSLDQTPYRKDERERIKKYGARILSMDQIEGIEPHHENWGEVNLGEDIDEGGDPPRVWSPHGDFPGTAFTRSFGDRLAEDLGVTAEAEILVRDLGRNDKMVIIASDGVFEFLTNQMVADIASRFVDPLEACQAIATQAYNLWLQYEVRTDDITIIAIFAENYNDQTIAALTSPDSINSGFSLRSIGMEERPVRRMMSKDKKKTIIVAQDEEKIDCEDIDVDIEALKAAKTVDERLAIDEAIKNNFLFQHLNNAQRQHVIDYMVPVIVSKGDVVIRQGDKGDRFYVVDSGSFEVRVNSGSTDQNEGTVVHVYRGGKNQHPGFGELSLMYGKPRAASVYSLEEGKLWALDRRVFRSLVMRSTDVRKGIIKTMKRVELLRCLTTHQMQRLADLLVEASFPTNHYIIRQGEIGDNFYLIVKGNCDCTVNLEGEAAGGETLVLQLSDNDYFGEKALLTSNPRAANVVTRAPTKVLYINKSAFEEVLGPLSSIIDEDRARREAVGTGADVPRSISDVSVFAVVCPDPVSPMLLGTFGKVLESSTEIGNKHYEPNITIRSFILSEADNNSVSESVVTSIEAARLVTSFTKSSPCPFLPPLLSVLKDKNAFHLVHDVAVVCDLATIIAFGNEKAGSTRLEGKPGVASIQHHSLRVEVVTYIAACVVSAIQILHSIGIVYRNIQPESIFVNSAGKVLLLDYRMSKVGMDSVHGKTYTVCGCSDYLSPEQISQRGHGTPVDFWALGVLLYELSAGVNPFSSPTEVETYSKISSFGSKSFPSLSFPDFMSPETKLFVNHLLVPAPEARLGASAGGIEDLKKHRMFLGFDWSTLEALESPLASTALSELEEVGRYEVDNRIFDSFGKDYETRSGWEKSIDIQ